MNTVSRSLIAGFCLAIAAPCMAEMIVARRGQPAACSIVHAADASAPIILAAKELQDFTCQMTGVELPIVSDAEALPPQAILVGPSRHSAAIPGVADAMAALGSDGFLLRRSGPHLLIIGDERGTLYGVYELLERAGCRWYASWHSNIPSLDQWALPDDLNVVERPAFRMREPFWYDMFNTFQALRNKCNGNAMRLGPEHGDRFRIGAGMFCHTFNRLVPPEEFFASHPEYYSEINGKRLRDHSQLCLSNPDVLRIATERTLAHIRKDPGAAMFSVSQNDWRNPCACANCLALHELYGNEAGILLWFVNQVAEAVEKEFPDVLIETLAYQYTREPPKNIRPRRNVMHRLCTIECDFARPIDQSDDPQNQKFISDIKGWSAITEKLFIWDYVTNFRHYLGPHPNFKALQGNIQFFRDNHVIGIMEQGAYQGYHAEFAELRGWLLAKLLWNPDLNMAALLDDFFSGYYGPAAPLVRQYFDALQALVEPPENKVKIFHPLTMPWYSDEFFRWATDIWQQAEEVVKDQPAFLYNVRKGAITVYYARVERMTAPVITFSWQDDQVLPTNVPEDYLQLVKALLARMDGERPIRICESADTHAALLAKWRRAVEGLPVNTISNGSFRVGIAPAMNGCAGIFKDSRGVNYFDSDYGTAFSLKGIQAPRQAASQLFSVKNESPERLDLSYTQRNQYRLDRSFALANDGLSVQNSVSNLSNERELSLEPVTDFTLALGNSGHLCWRLDDGPWQNLVTADLRFAMHSIRNDKLATAKSFTIASAHSGRGMRFAMAAEHARIVIQTRSDRDSTTVSFVQPALALARAATHSSGYTLLPMTDINDLPKAITSKALPPEQQRMVLEDCFLPIIRPGSWGDYGSDDRAEDGSALILYNSHYEWCSQLRPDLSLFAPQQPYRVRARIRVEKARADGLAFWAGIYDAGKRQSVSSHVFANKDISDDNYHWYDIGPANNNWVPAQEQYIWFGPGQFDKKKESSAVKAVYIDKIEFVPVLN